MLAASPAHGQSMDAFPPAQQQRIAQAVNAATELLTTWLGPPAAPIAAGPDIRVRWLAPVRDQSLEREVIASVARQFWGVPATPTMFHEAVVVYTGTRAIHHVLEGSNFEVVRLFGGLLPYPLRSVLLSPPVADPRPRVWQFMELSATGDAARVVRGLQTLERYAGWPAMAQALSQLRTGQTIDAASFAATLSQVRGTAIQPLVQECFRTDAVFDYAIANVHSVDARDGLVESSLSVLRPGSGVFAIGDDTDREPSMPLLVRFADGTELRDWFDGRAPSTTLIYTAKTAVVSAAIDPELMLLLDVNRSNNTFTAESPVRPLGIRLALHWMSWLQQTMLAYSALV
jgi:hypothetical protein